MRKICFVVMGYGKKTIGGKTYDLDKAYEEIIKPSFKELEGQCNIELVRGDETCTSNMIDKPMYYLLTKADYVIADITTLNHNALYELGFRHAVKPHATKIMMGCDSFESKVPFDINHQNILMYQHHGDGIHSHHVSKTKQTLKEWIVKVHGGNQTETDSPFYNLIKITHPLTINEEGYQISDFLKPDSIYIKTEQAKQLRKENRFADAAMIWKELSQRSPTVDLYVQQHSLCTRKSNEKDKQTLYKALEIIETLIPEKSDSAETIGIAAATYKNLFLTDVKSLDHLKKAKDLYHRGYTLSKDYYNGENYIICMFLELKFAELNERKRNHIEYTIEDVCTEIRDICLAKEIDPGFKEDKDFWIYATLARCCFILNEPEKQQTYEEKFLNHQGFEPFHEQTYRDNSQYIYSII